MKHANINRTLIFRLFAIGLLIFFLADTIIKYVRGGDSAPSTVLLLLSILVLGGGIIVIGILTWREWKRMKQEQEYFEEE